MPVTECLSRVTHREYLIWMERFREEWNEPSRTDYYLMQIAATQIMSKKRFSLDKLRIKFTTDRPSRTTTDVQMDKARWALRLGIKVPDHA